MMASRAPKGFTLIELMVTIAVAGILLSLAAPSFSSFIDKYRAKRAADTISAFLVNTKTEAIKRNTPVRAVFQSADSGANWCVGMTTLNTCDCMTANACRLNYDDDDGDVDVDRSIRSTNFKGIILTSPADGEMFSFTPQRGTASSGNAQIQSSGGLQVRVVVTGMGRIRLCSPSGSGNVGGYPECT